MSARIILGADNAAAICAAAMAAYPLECCGLLIGDLRGDLAEDGADRFMVRRVVATLNVAPDPARHFEIDPQTLFDHMRSARESNMRIIGHYHSHPNGRAEPSAADLVMAHDASVWVIAAVTNDGVSLRAFVPADASFREILLGA